MLTICGTGPGPRFCDGLSRRDFLTIGGLSWGVGGLSLAGLWRAEQVEAAPGPGAQFPRHKSVINIFLAGGPPHQDLWDLKTDAPSEIRGEFKPIQTRVPGIQICEVFPLLAERIDSCAIIRSVVGCEGNHDAVQCMTGWPGASLRSIGGRPSLGAAVARVQGPTDPAVPPFVGLTAQTKHAPWADPGQPGFLGPAHGAFRPDGPDMDNMVLKDLSLERLADRRTLLASVDRLRRDADASGIMAGMDAFGQRAFDVLSGSRMLSALDVMQESPTTRAAYGDGKPYRWQYDGAPTANEHLLMARRLVEAGVRVVSLSYGRWDSHGDNFATVRDHGGKLDQCLSALIDDLRSRGMLDDVAVVVWGKKLGRECVELDGGTR